jgi:hypothetical protein
MYQLNLFDHASKLAALTADWPSARIQQPNTEPHLHTSLLRLALDELANLATLCVMPSSVSGTAKRHDPRDPQNW